MLDRSNDNVGSGSMRNSVKLIFAVSVSMILTATGPVMAGGILLREESVRINGSTAKEIISGSENILTFEANDYEYGSNNFKYVFFSIESITAVPSKFKKNYYVLLTDPRKERASRDGPTKFSIKFNAPAIPAGYRISYNQVPKFMPNAINIGDEVGKFVEAIGNASNIARMAIADYPGMNRSITAIKVLKDIDYKNQATLYLRQNNKTPSYSAVNGGLAATPIKFDWSIGPETKLPHEKFIFRYKLWPVDDDYGAWTKDKTVSYRFLQKGNYSFSVQAAYDEGKPLVSNVEAYTSFDLRKTLIASSKNEILTKGPDQKTYTINGQEVDVNVEFERIYAKSKALIVGVYNFEDASSFTRFGSDKITNDISAMKAALNANGFDVEELIGSRVTRENVMVAVEKMVNEAGKGDRLFIYFSTHGFPDPRQASAGWIATSDCFRSKPSVGCVSLKDLETHANRALDKPTEAKQVLIAVDSCFSGLGVISKSVSVPNFSSLASKPGAYMLTAGMANQLAEIDLNLGMSTFTYYLAKGLRGEAKNFDRNGVMTLSDLYVYVQYNVAQKTNSRQIPMLGRLTGDGEMLFKPSPTN